MKKNKQTSCLLTIQSISRQYRVFWANQNRSTCLMHFSPCAFPNYRKSWTKPTDSCEATGKRLNRKKGCNISRCYGCCSTKRSLRIRTRSHDWLNTIVSILHLLTNRGWHILSWNVTHSFSSVRNFDCYSSKANTLHHSEVTNKRRKQFVFSTLTVFTFGF